MNVTEIWGHVFIYWTTLRLLCLWRIDGWWMTHGERMEHNWLYWWLLFVSSAFDHGKGVWLSKSLVHYECAIICILRIFTKHVEPNPLSLNSIMSVSRQLTSIWLASQSTVAAGIGASVPGCRGIWRNGIVQENSGPLDGSAQLCCCSGSRCLALEQ